MTAALFEDADRYGREWRTRLGSDSALAQQVFRQTFNRLLEEPAADTLLLSGEVFSLYSVDDLSMLRDHLLRHARRLRVVVYLRNSITYLESNMQQRVRADRPEDRSSLVGIMTRRLKKLQHVFSTTIFGRIASTR